jgi:hypothetical protein
MVFTHFSVNSFNAWYNHSLSMEAKILQPQLTRPLEIETFIHEGTGP